MIDPLPGDIFRKGEVLNNTYEIEGVLGRGGSGEVYRARNQITGRVVAVKALNREFSANADYHELLKREEEMRAISHDAVVRYTDCSRTDKGHLFLVMDFVDGTPLSHWLERGGANPRALLVVAHRVAEALVATHAAGIVHRDLSPDNIVLRGDEPEQATIIDFGIAKDTRSGARTVVGSGFAGKYEYAAPEQMHGMAEPRSDLYALGASLLATFRGRVPEVGASPGEVVRSKEKPLDTTGVPEPLKSLVDELTQPDPARRLPSAAAVVAAIDAMLRPTPAPRKRRLWPLLVPLGAVALGGALWLSGLLDAWLQDPPPVSYGLTASRGAEGVGLEGYAPDAEQRATIADAFALAAGAEPVPDAVVLAPGAPTPEWGDAVAGLLKPLAPLEEWSLDIRDGAAAVRGLAPDVATRDAAAAAIAAAAAAADLVASVELDAGPRDLPASSVDALLAPLQTCGPLSAAGPASYPLGATVPVTGFVADAAGPAAIEQALRPRIGDRTLRLEVETLNAAVCAVLAVLPDAPAGELAIAFGYGDRPEANGSGVYAAGDNPTIDLAVPAELQGFAWVTLVDVAGNAYNLLPHANRPDHALAATGEVENGLRRIRVAYPMAERARDRLAFEVAGPFGKSLILAFVTEAPLFPALRPSEESAVAFARDLEAALRNGGPGVRFMSSRLIESRESSP